jgi:hypothetical protein
MRDAELARGLEHVDCADHVDPCSGYRIGLEGDLERGEIWMIARAPAPSVLPSAQGPAADAAPGASDQHGAIEVGFADGKILEHGFLAWFGSERYGSSVIVSLPG